MKLLAVEDEGRSWDPQHPPRVRWAAGGAGIPRASLLATVAESESLGLRERLPQ